MARERIILGAAGAVCVGLLAAALMLPRGTGSGGAEGPAPAGAAEPQPGAAGGAGAAAGPGTAAGSGAAPGASSAAGPEAAETPAAGASPLGAATPEEPSQGSFSSEQNRRDVLLFFEESQGENLGPEKRKIFLTTSPVDQAKQIVVELISGPREGGLLPTLPTETRLLGLYLDRAGTAFVDLSKDLVTLHPGGTSEELATIFSLVDSLTYNLPEIKRVHILVEGEERDTLKDHLDLRRDYLPDMSIVDMEGMK